MKEKYPKYVTMGGTYFRLRGDMYWCDAGEWYIGVKKGPTTYSNENFETTNLYSVSHMSGLNNKPIFPCSESEWAKKTGEYVPKGYRFESDNNDYSSWKGYDDYDGCDEVVEIDDLCDENATPKSEVKYEYLLIGS